MKTKTLLISVGGIFLVTLLAYFLISPIASNKIEEEYQEFVNETEEEVVDDKETVPVKTETVTPVKVTTPTETKPVTTTPVVETPIVKEEVKSGYTAAEVSQHSSESSCWSIINGSVYDLTAYVPKHPGGSSKILRICGKDGSSAFEGQHGGESKPENILLKYRIGDLI